MTKVAIMFGGNLPGSAAAMKTALHRLRAGGFRVTRCSALFSSKAVDCVPGTPDFLDQAVTGLWAGTPAGLLKLCQWLEFCAGRPVLHSSRESRILDCDLILFGEKSVSTEYLTIPHPRAERREFVLAPLAEIAGSRRFPDGMTVAEKLAALRASE